MKKTRIISLMMVFVLCFTLFPTQAFAWKNLTHVNSADIILLEMKRSAKANSNQASVKLGGKKYDVPKEFQDALFTYPDAFRAGSMGPDFYPDIVTGQMYIHPYDTVKNIGSGEWVTLLCDSLNRMPKDSAQRKEALAFTLGVMLHFCGDLFGHDFINAFSGGAYPSLTDVNYANLSDPNLNYILSHMAEETYMDKQVNYSFYDNADYLDSGAPIQFVADTMVFNGSVNGGAAKIFSKYGSVPPQYVYLINLRTTLYNKANEWRVSVNPLYSGAVMYLDAWIEDIDKATFAFLEAFDRIANRLVTEADASTVGIVQEELTNWLDNYGMYITPAPDVLIDVMKFPAKVTETILDAIGAQTLLDKFHEWKSSLIKGAVLWCVGIALPEIAALEDRLTDPEVQLDHHYNPFDPSGSKENFAEFKEYMDRYAMEQALLNGLSIGNLINGTDGGALDKLIDSDLEAFYNTMTMFKMVLIGADEFTDFVDALSGETQTAYKENTGELAATGLKLKIATTDAQDAGTDDNIFAVVYKKGESTPLIKKLLDISGYNDFEAGDNDEYFVELPEAVPVDEIEVHIVQEGTGLYGPGWDCANINITPVHADTELITPVGVGGNPKMNSGKTWDLRFQEALTARDIANKTTQEVMNLKIWINTKDKWGSGTDGDVYLVAYNDGAEWVKILLDKQGYNDFEAGDKDTYDVSLAKITEAGGIMTGKGIPLDKLTFKLVVEANGTAGIGWDVEKAKVTPYYGNLALANEIDLGGYTDIRPGNEWWPDFQGRLSGSTGHGGGYTTYSGIELTYDTYVDDGLLGYMHSLDDSTQWRNDDNILWKNTTIREKVFHFIFKGFAPEIEYDGSAIIEKGEAFDMEATFDGFWNGITRERRNEGTAGVAAPEVSGTAVFSFINSKGAEVCSKSVTFTNGVAEVNTYSDASLDLGIYDVKVTYQTDGQYASTEKTFEDALAVSALDEHYIKVSASPAEGGTVSGGNDYKEDDEATVTATAAPWYRFVAWKESGTAVSTDANYTFTVKSDRELVAEFEPIPMVDLVVTKEPDKVTYRAGDSFDSAGMIVEAVYENGDTKEIPDYTLIDADVLKKDQTEVIISYTENGVTLTTEQPISVTVGSSSSSSKKFDIVIEDSENGDVKASRTNAKRGTTITITTDPDEGYCADDIAVVTIGGNVVDVKDIGNGKFTFEMPGSSVTVAVDFVKADAEDIQPEEIQPEEIQPEDIQNDKNYILLTIGNVLAEVFGEYVVNDVSPIIRNERTMLPARFVAEALGAEVAWDEANQKVTIVKDDITLEIFINEPFAVVNGAPVELDSPAFIENDRTYLPLRFIVENLGATVVWDETAQTIEIIPGK